MQRYTNKQVSGVCLPTNTTAVNRDNHTWGFTTQTNRWLRRVSGAIARSAVGFSPIAVSLAMSLLAATQALAGSFSITKITDNQSDFTSISNNGAAINDNGTIGFIASPRVGDLGIYTSDRTQITEIINQSVLASLYGLTLNGGRRLTFSFNSVDINNKGSVAFIATQSEYGSPFAEQRIFTSLDGSFTTRAKDSNNGRYGPVTFITALNNQDELAYLNINRSFNSSSGSYGSTTLVLTKENQPDVTIASASINPNLPADTPFSTIDAFAFNNQGEVTFAATRRDGTAAIFAQDGDGPTSIVETKASALATNDKGDLVLSSGDAIRSFDRASGTLNTIADPTNSSLKAFSNLAINNNNNVAFTATLDSGEKGIFTGADPVADKVIATGDSLAGSIVTNLSFLRSGLNNNNQIAFSVQLANGTQGIFRAEPVTQTPPPQPGPSVEDAFALSKIVDTLTPIPGGVGNFTYFNSVLIDGDNVVFDGSSYTSISQPGIYKSSGGILSAIANKNTPIPNGSGTFTNFSLDSIDNGNILFRGSGTNLQGIYIKRGETPLSVVVDSNTPIPGGTENFSSFYGLAQGQNNVAFGGKGASGQGGIYILQDGSLQVVADRNTPIPGGTGNFDRFGSLALDENNVAFSGYGAGSDQRGIYISRNGSLQVVVDRNTAIPGGTGNFDNFGSWALAENNVVFNSNDSNNSVQGIYILQDGSLQVVADRNTPIPGGTGNFKSFSSAPPSVLGKKNVVFKAEDANGQQGIYIRRHGALQVLVDANTTIPGSTIKFRNFSFSDPVVDGKNVAFVARVGDVAGIYAKVGDSLLKVADLSSRVDGKRISYLGSIALKGNSLAVSATFTDGTIAIVRADLSAHK